MSGDRHWRGGFSCLMCRSNVHILLTCRSQMMQWDVRLLNLDNTATFLLRKERSRSHCACVKGTDIAEWRVVSAYHVSHFMQQRLLVMFLKIYRDCGVLSICQKKKINKKEMNKQTARPFSLKARVELNKVSSQNSFRSCEVTRLTRQQNAMFLLKCALKPWGVVTEPRFQRILR